MKRVFEPITLHDRAPTEDDFLEGVLTGLRRAKKTTPSKFLYDERGSHLFDRICDLQEYYPTRTEIGIMRAYAPEMARLCGPHCVIFEMGSGSSTKTPILLDRLESPAAYAPIDISREHLIKSAAVVAERYPQLKVLPICADFTTRFDLPEHALPDGRRIVYFPGSTIGNLMTAAAVSCLGSIAELCRHDGGVLIGVDLIKDADVLQAAYDDDDGVTAEFNLNLLRRINRELGADFNLDRFRHRAFFNAAQSRMEMHLESLADQTVALNGHKIQFTRGETIHTEDSHKYSLDTSRDLAAAASLEVRKVWTDPGRLFSVQYLTPS